MPHLLTTAIRRANPHKIEALTPRPPDSLNDIIFLSTSLQDVDLSKFQFDLYEKLCTKKYQKLCPPLLFCLSQCSSPLIFRHSYCFSFSFKFFIYCHFFSPKCQNLIKCTVLKLFYYASISVQPTLFDFQPFIFSLLFIPRLVHFNVVFSTFFHNLSSE